VFGAWVECFMIKAARNPRIVESADRWPRAALSKLVVHDLKYDTILARNRIKSTSNGLPLPCDPAARSGKSRSSRARM
jgi:hypothetical protein